MRANIYASRECYDNKTAVHNASEYGHYGTIIFLLNWCKSECIRFKKVYSILDVEKMNKLGNISANGAMNGNNLPKYFFAIPRKGNCKQIK